ncbi:hypothetical protein [Thermococcus sp. JCM 11816]
MWAIYWPKIQYESDKTFLYALKKVEVIANSVPKEGSGNGG